MTKFAAIVLTLLLAATLQVEAVTTSNAGARTIYKLQVVKDITLERGGTNWNNLEYLIVGLHPGFPKKRSLLQFEDLPSNCTTLHRVFSP